MPRKPSDKRINEAIAALDRVRKQWLRKPGVTAVDVGFKISDNVLTDTLALRVHVAQKKDITELAASEVFNDQGNPQSIDGFPVDVIEATYGPSQQAPIALEDVAPQVVSRTARTRPIIGGISCGNPRVTAGTLGAIVYSRDTCKAMILSNFHILAGALAASAGEPIHQPGRLDGGTSSDRVATLLRYRIDAQMDAAVATIDAGVTFDREVLELGTVSGVREPTLGINVTKSGRTTGVTQGVIDGVSLTVSINYGSDVGVVTLTNQVHIVPRPPWPAVDYEVSMGGDSGSVWLEEGTNRAVGLHFGGETDPSPASENALCTPISRVAGEFNISFLPVLCPVAPPPVLTFCQRYPRICELIRIYLQRHALWPPVPPGPGLDPGPLMRDQAGGCGCGASPHGVGPGHDVEAILAELKALLAEGER
jgi:hypothetical protein